MRSNVKFGQSIVVLSFYIYIYLGILPLCTEPNAIIMHWAVVWHNVHEHFMVLVSYI